MNDLFQEIQRKTAELEQSVKALRRTGTDFAEAERAYKIACSQTALKLKDEGMPVTLIDKVIYGHKDVVDLRFKRDVAEAIYDANKEHINATKLYIRILEEQLKREWSTPLSE